MSGASCGEQICYLCITSIWLPVRYESNPCRKSLVKVNRHQLLHVLCYTLRNCTKCIFMLFNKDYSHRFCLLLKFTHFAKCISEKMDTSITLLSKYWFNCSFPKSWNLFLQYIKFETAKWKLIYTKEFIWSENYIFIEIAYIDVMVPIVDMNS